MNKPEAIRDIANKVAMLAREALGGQITDAMFATFLQEYDQRLQKIMRPVKHRDTDQHVGYSEEWKSYAADTLMIQWCERNSITLTNKPWRWCRDQSLHDLQGFQGGVRGYPRITDGVEVWIEQVDGSLFLGHLEWFEKEKVEKVDPWNKVREPKTRKPKAATKTLAQQEREQQTQTMKDKLLALLNQGS